MSYAEVMALLPLIITAATAVVMMLVISLYRSHAMTVTLGVAGLTLAIISLAAAFPYLPVKVTPLLVLDRYAFVLMGMLFFATVTVFLFAHGYLEKRGAAKEEFYLLALLATFGAAVLVASSHFISFFLGLETLTVSLYALLGYLRTDRRGLEAAIKYLITASVSSAFLLFGMALLYAQLGTMEFNRLAEQAVYTGPHSILILAASVMIIAGIGFKLAVVPFQLWTPDVYEGAPAPVTAFVATVSKGAVFGLLIRYFGRPEITLNNSLFVVFSVIAITSMCAGNLLALFQNNVKRILACSSIAHLGYLLVAFLSTGPSPVHAALFYLVTYFIATLAAFGVVIFLSGPEEEADTLGHYRSLAWRRPYIAGVFTVSLMSLAGIPLTAGFIGKFFLLSAGVGSSLWLLVISLALNSAIGLFYYLRIVRIMFEAPEQNAEACLCVPSSLSGAGSLMLALLSFLMIWLGVYPGQLIEVLKGIVIGQ